MDELVASVRSAFRLCLFDGPATLPSVDAEILAEKVDGIVIVVRAFHTPRPRLAAALARLRATGTPIIGAVLMDARTDAATSEAA
jgi:Mrp family chromosome partitioning ATPase